VTPAGILVVGEAIGDFIPQDAGGRQYEAVLGGSGFNAALALARFGAGVSYAGALSTDALGRRFRAALAQEGIDAGLVRESARPSAVAIVAPLRADGVPEFGLYLDGTAHQEPDGTPRRCPDGIVHLHAASFGATAGPSGEATLALTEDARSQGASVSYHINIRPSALPERPEAIRAIEQRIARADIVKASLEDLAWLHPGREPDAVAQDWLALGARLVLVTRGGEGATCHSAGETLFATAPQVMVSDTVGAGDTFIGGFLAFLAARGLLGRQAQAPSRGVLQRALEFACAGAADSCTRPGCDPPRRRAADYPA
jgi:fructokinase